MKDYKEESLIEITPVRFFRGDKKTRNHYIRYFKGRWTNDSAFIRSSIQFFQRYLDKEILQLERQKKQPRRKT